LERGGTTQGEKEGGGGEKSPANTLLGEGKKRRGKVRGWLREKKGGGGGREEKKNAQRRGGRVRRGKKKKLLGVIFP